MIRADFKRNGVSDEVSEQGCQCAKNFAWIHGFQLGRLSVSN
jgi:hypothetical protein